MKKRSLIKSRRIISGPKSALKVSIIELTPAGKKALSIKKND